MKLHPIPLITICLFFSFTLYGQDHPILLKTGSFTPEKNITATTISEFNRSSQRVSGKSFAIIQFEQIPTPSVKQQLSNAGILLMEYVPNNAYTVTITRNIDLSILQTAKARALIQLSPEQKMHPK